MKQILAGAFVAFAFASPALAGTCNGVGSWTSCTDDKGNNTQIWNYGNGNYNTMTTDKKGNSRTEYYHNWNEDQGDGNN